MRVQSSGFARRSTIAKTMSAIRPPVVPVEIHNPKGEKVYTETLTSDNYGGIAGKFELPADATLGPVSACRSSTAAAARSASRNTRSRSSKSPSKRRPSR